MSYLFIPTETIQSAYDWIDYDVREQHLHAPDLLHSLESLLQKNSGKESITVPRDLLQSTLTWIHYERRATGKDRPQIETTLQNIFREVNRKEKS